MRTAAVLLASAWAFDLEVHHAIAKVTDDRRLKNENDIQNAGDTLFNSAMHTAHSETSVQTHYILSYTL